MGNSLTRKEKLEFEAKATEAMLYRMNKLDKKRNFRRKLIIFLFFLFLFCALVTCVVWHSWQIIFYCGFGLVCLFGIFEEQIYEKHRKEILNAFNGPDNINLRFF
jgi:hypothetical protein